MCHWIIKCVDSYGDTLWPIVLADTADEAVEKAKQNNDTEIVTILKIFIEY